MSCSNVVGSPKSKISKRGPIHTAVLTQTLKVRSVRFTVPLAVATTLGPTRSSVMMTDAFAERPRKNTAYLAET